jgi:hypothetical protein
LPILTPRRHYRSYTPKRSWEYVPFTETTQNGAPFSLTFHEFLKRMQKNEKKRKKMRAFETFRIFRLPTLTPYQPKLYNNSRRFP